MGQLNLCVETIHYFEGINVTVLERMHQFIALYNQQRMCRESSYC